MLVDLGFLTFIDIALFLTGDGDILATNISCNIIVLSLDSSAWLEVPFWADWKGWSLYYYLILKLLPAPFFILLSFSGSQIYVFWHSGTLESSLFGSLSFSGR